MKTKHLIVVAFSLCLMFTQLSFSQGPNYSNQTHKDSIYSNLMNENRTFWVRLPDTYNPESSEKYPVVFILDGGVMMNNLTTVYDNYWGHYMPHMILVGIATQENRTRDLTPTKITSRNGGTMQDDSGGGETLTKFVGKELIPHIEKNYPASDYRTLIGHSYAGLFAINILLHHPELFKNYIAIDPTLDWDNQKMVKDAATLLTTQNYKGKSLYMSMAGEQIHMFDASVTKDNFTEDTSDFTLFPRSIAEFATIATNSAAQSNLNFKWKIYPEELHGTIPLPTMIDGLQFVFNWFQFKTPQKYNNPETTVDELEELLSNQEKIYTANYGYPSPPMVEELFIGYGYMNMQMGNPDKAELFFKNAVKYYPKSANAYDSYGEFLESQEKIKEALTNATKAFEISGNEYHKERISSLKAKLQD